MNKHGIKLLDITGVQTYQISQLKLLVSSWRLIVSVFKSIWRHLFFFRAKAKEWFTINRFSTVSSKMQIADNKMANIVMSKSFQMDTWINTVTVVNAEFNT